MVQGGVVEGAKREFTKIGGRDGIDMLQRRFLWFILAGKRTIAGDY